MSNEDLIEAIKAADVGPFREVRLVTLVHHKGVTPEVVETICKELKEVNDEEAHELNHLKQTLKAIEQDVETLKALKGVVGKIKKTAAAAH
ncbi:MAG: hypothetical protein HZB70_03340 [Candidatus Berkelbacteria bacterium]|nr:MAG: hypothetical protein HZB70_03340 [Candidatus Berkelbacteria bacterium]QQG51664.1 MAG: hypothetical protein HY845_03850 [Candidatus Berkelbacteria bacterium]